jgi:DNA-binding transcriptional ArsR family regulator
MKHAGAVAELSRQLAHPLRVTLLSHVAEHGPCAFSELVAAAGVAQAQVGNHLSLLRKAGLLVTERQGRQSLYRLPNAHLAEALANLAAAAGVTTEAEAPAVAEARACYDHLGGKLGVAVLNALVRQEIITGETDLIEGPAIALLSRFGVADPAPLHDTRRRFAYGCPDWTEHAPHLGGSLGAAIAGSFVERQWIRRRMGSRIVDVTGKGRTALRKLGVEV